MQAETTPGSQKAEHASSSPRSRRRGRWLVVLVLMAGAGVFFWLMANHAMRASTITLSHDTEIKILGGFTGAPVVTRDERPGLTIGYELTVKDESFEQWCKDLWNRLHKHLPSWATGKIKAFPSPKQVSYGIMKPQAIALAASQPMDFAEWSITVKDDSGRSIPVFASTPPPKTPSGTTPPVRLLQGEFPSDNRQLTLRFEFRGVRRKGLGGKPLEYPVSELTIDNPFHGQRVPTTAHPSSKGFLGTQRIIAEHFRLDMARTELLQEVTFRFRCDPWRDADDGVHVWDTTICNPAGGWDAMPLVTARRLPAEQAQEIVCRVSGWPSTAPLRVRFWLSPRFSRSRPPPTSFEFQKVMVPAPGLGMSQNMTARSGNTTALLFSVQNRSEGTISFRLTDWRITPQHECISWYLRDPQENTTHPETGAEYLAWEVEDEVIGSNRIAFCTNLPTDTKWFDVGLAEVLPQMVELEFPSKR